MGVKVEGMNREIERTLLKILEQHGALLRNGHFVFGATWMHADAYIDKDALFPHEADVQYICDAMGDPFEHDEVDTVVGSPTNFGTILSYLIARRLRDSPERWKHGVIKDAPHGIPVNAVFAKKNTDDAFEFAPHFIRLVQRKRVLVVDDVLASGGSAQKIIELVRARGGTVVGLSVICNRGSIKPADVGNPPKLHTLVTMPLPMYNEDDCPLCKEGKPINTTVGRGNEYLARKTASVT